MTQTLKEQHATPIQPPWGRSPWHRLRWHRNIAQVARVVLFLLFLAVPGILLPIKYEWKPHGRWEESAAMPEMPTNLAELREFPRGFEKMVRANFGLRKDLINLHAKIMPGDQGPSSGLRVITGKDNWLFLGEAGVINNYRGVAPFKDEELATWCRALESRRRWLAEKGIAYVVVISPDKHSIYGERYLPSRINRVKKTGRQDQLIEYMRQHSGVEIVDLRPKLLEVAKTDLCYLPRNTHWNPLGAYWGYRVLAQRLSTVVPAVQPYKLEDLDTVVAVQALPDDLPRMLGIDDERNAVTTYRPKGGWHSKSKPAKMIHAIPEGWPKTSELHEVMTNPSASAGTAVLIHDSFFQGLPRKLLAEHFSEVRSFWADHDLFPLEDIVEAKPVVVIQEMVERKLMEIKPSRMYVVGESGQ